jgi:hypothetical protein
MRKGNWPVCALVSTTSDKRRTGVWDQTPLPGRDSPAADALFWRPGRWNSAEHLCKPAHVARPCSALHRLPAHYGTVKTHYEQMVTPEKVRLVQALTGPQDDRVGADVRPNGNEGL